MLKCAAGYEGIGIRTEVAAVHLIGRNTTVTPLTPMQALRACPQSVRIEARNPDAHVTLERKALQAKKPFTLGIVSYEQV